MFMACPEDILCAAAMGCVFEGTVKASLDDYPCVAKLYVWSGRIPTKRAESDPTN